MLKSSKPKLVALGNELGALLDIQRAVSAWYDVLQTQDARRALAFVDHCPAVQAIVAEHVLATTTGVTVLESARAIRPDVRRVLLTAFPDLATVGEGLRSGVCSRW